MARFEPFEPAPQIAIAVSGGPDSMALVLLADRWARERGGAVIGLTVDHRLRLESAAEAETVARWLAARGMRHRTLVWTGPYPTGNRQSAARDARYDLLNGWCRDDGILHVLLGHHQADQAETMLLRLARGTGAAGLSAMAGVTELADCRLLRPLLGMAPDRLRATLRMTGQAWLDDPSNRNPAFDRARLRSHRPAFDQAGLDAGRLASAATHLGRARDALDRYLATALARCASLHPAGIAMLKAEQLKAYPEEIRLRALAAMLRTVSGSAYAPRFEPLARLDQALISGTIRNGVTLGGCRVTPSNGDWLIYRERAAIAPSAAIPSLGTVIWDRRFSVRRVGEPVDADGVRVGAFGEASIDERRAIVEAMAAPHFLAKKVWPSLPGVWQEGRLIDVPHLGWRLPDIRVIVDVRFRPDHPLSAVGFAY